MSETEEPEEHRQHLRNEAEEVPYVFDDLLDELSAILKLESSPVDPDFMARKSTVKRELDMYSLDPKSRIKKIAKMKNEAAAVYQQAEDALSLKPKDLLLKVRLETAAEALRRAIFMDEVERELLVAEHKADDVDLPELREKISYEVNYNFNVIVGMFKVNLQLRTEMKLPSNKQIWDRQGQEVKNGLAMIKSKVLTLAGVLPITEHHFQHPEDFEELLTTINLEQLSLTLKITNDLYNELNTLNIKMQKDLGKSQ